jgi:NADPH-dependent curcumin reductase
MPIARHTWRLARRPVGEIADQDLTFQEESLADPGDGEVLVATRFLSLDPTYRAWMSELPGYLPPVPIGDVMRGMGVGEVVASNHPRIPVGANVSGMLGWASHAVLKGDSLQLLDPAFSLEEYVAVLNHIGATAYFGVKEVAPVKKGDTFVVSAAAGAVGSLAGQIAKIEGAGRVVGIASTPEKCRWLTDELGFDAAIDRKAEDIGPGLDRTCPKGIDVYFDNVGGPILDACLARIRLHARIALCGLISQYNATKPPPGPHYFPNILVRRARLEGFIILDYGPRFGEAFAALGTWLREGKLEYRLETVDGLPAAVEGLRRLFRGENTGKMAVKV